ncbi:glutathione S-transferase [Algihabitans albus]|uniref:glutathione S-transferase n=1 Tax=Algihabitans albus TaxID=2164067 RepID=UPI001ABBFABA|nr:glutathione S-transferase [Algihabitans albus]
MAMKLYFSSSSPFVRKVRIAAIELGLDDRIELIPTAVVPGKPNADYAREANPLRRVPALTTESGQVLYDSTVICEYLDDRAGGGRLIPQDRERRWQVLTSHALAQGMCESAVLLRYETWLRPEAQRWSVWIDDQWDKIDSGLKWFEEHEQVLREPIDLGQIALGVLLGYLDFRSPDKDWRQDAPKVAAWYGTFCERPSLRETEPANPPS